MMPEAPLSLHEQVMEGLRRGRFPEALAFQRKLLAERRAAAQGANPGLAADELLEAELGLKFVERAAELPPVGRWALARAQRLEAVRKGCAEAGRYQAAQRVARLRFAIRRRWLGDDFSESFYDIKNLAESTQSLGDLAGAEALHREALVLSQRFFGRHGNTATALLNLGTLLRARQELAEAESCYREALAIRRERLGADHPHTADCLNNLGNLHLDRGDAAAAERAHREALAIRRAALPPGDPQIAMSLNNLAMTLVERGDLTEAGSIMAEALAMRRERLGEAHPLVARSLSNMGMIQHLRGNFADAERHFRAAVELHRQTLGPTHRNAAESIANLGYHLLTRGDAQAAEALFGDWSEVFEPARETSGPGLAPARALVSHYPALAIARLRLGAMRGAWEATERHFGRLLTDWITVHEQEALAAVREQERSVSALKARVEALAVASGSSDAPSLLGVTESARDRLLVAEARFAAAHAEWLRQRRTASTAGPFPLERVQAALSDRAAIVGWLDVESRLGISESWGFVVRNRGEVQWARLSTGASPTEHAGRMRSRLADPEEWWGDALMAASQALWRERMQPLTTALAEVDELVVVPSGAMLGIPIEALIDEAGMVMGDEYIVSYSPSATLHTWLVEHRRDNRRDGRTALFIGDPPFSAAHVSAMRAETENTGEPGTGTSRQVRKAPRRDRAAIAELPRLAGSRREITALAPHFACSTILVGEEAAERRLLELAAKDQLRSYDVVHIATHAFVDDETPERSALVLSQADLPDPLAAALADQRIETGLVTAADIARDFRLDAELVTLSACETGLGRAIGGEGYVGFLHAFFAAGARSQLVSLWKVDDQATSLLMSRFYENWLGVFSEERADFDPGHAMGKATALREAKGWLRTYTTPRGERPYEHPYFWAAFVLFGAR